MEIAILVVLTIACIGNIVLQIGNSMLLIKVFETLKGIQENVQAKEEAERIRQETKNKGQGLVDIATEQANYPLRLR